MLVAFVIKMGVRSLPRNQFNYPSQIQYIVNDKRKPSDDPTEVIHSNDDEQYN